MTPWYWPWSWTVLNTDGDQIITYLMKPVSEVITSPGTTKSFLSPEETDKETGFRIVGNLMSAAMLPRRFFFVYSRGALAKTFCLLPPPSET